MSRMSPAGYLSSRRRLSEGMFTVEYRNRVRERVIEMAKEDHRLVAGALIGSVVSGGDRWSDLDLTFALADDASLDSVLRDWTARLQGEFDAVRLFDLPHKGILYRVFHFPGSLQVDLSFTPRAEFGPSGPRFKPLFGIVPEKPVTTPVPPDYFFGLAVHHLVRARIYVERNRWWEAEWNLSEARNQTLALACRRLGLKTSYGRGFDDLPAEITKPFRETLVASLDREHLLAALSKMVTGLLANSQDVPDLASRLKPDLRELESANIS